MRNILMMSITGMMLMSLQVQAEELQPLKTQKDKVSYGIGVDMVRNFKRQGIEADLDLVIKGMRDGSTGVKLLMSDAEMKMTLADYQKELAGNQAQVRQLTAEKNKKDGAAFLAENMKKSGVVTTASGLQYKILRAGKGARPTDADSVTCRYRGTLIDGTEFDSSDRIGGYPLTFYVKDSIVAGWSEALKQMSSGSKWQVFVPPHLGYGEKGAGRDIGPNATLIYEIDLLVVNPETVVQKKKNVEEPPADVTSHKICPHCGMNRGDHDTSRMLITYDDGTSIGTCSLHCLTTELGKHSAKKVTSVQVADFNSKMLINAEGAYWVLGGDKKGVMSKAAAWAFGKHQEAEVFSRQHGGRLVRYKEALSQADMRE